MAAQQHQRKDPHVSEHNLLKKHKQITMLEQREKTVGKGVTVEEGRRKEVDKAEV